MTDLDPAVLVALIAASAAIAGAGLTLLGLFVTRGTETRKLLTAAPQGLVQLVDELQQERAELQVERAGLRAEMTRLIERDARREEEMASMRSRLRGLESGQDHDSRLIEALRLYVLELRTALRRASIPPPPAPSMLGIEDSGPLPAVGAP